MHIHTLQNDENFLRTPTTSVTQEQILELDVLIKDMIYIMNGNGGVGLAANQIGSNLSIFVIDKKVTQQPLDLVVINPKLIYHRTKTKKVFEGCLSIPGERKEIRRYEKVSLIGLNRYGNPIRIDKATGLLSQVLQHEYDHTKGILFIDLVAKEVEK